jgi:menaquinone-specific isochorismate synthase
MAEDLWQKGEELTAAAAAAPTIRRGAAVDLAATADVGSTGWQRGYRQAVARALELVEEGELQKLVLAVRQDLQLPQRLDPLTWLAQLRRSQPGSCRFLWQPAAAEALLGASPERLLTVRQGRLRCDALAGTAAVGADGSGAAADLLSSAKDRHEHELVVEAITLALRQRGLTPRLPRHPRLARHGGLLHLHTPITAELRGRHPLVLAEALHPTPAVAGLPRRQAMAWLRSLEPFDRGNYAAPIGWIDSHGDIDLRVAIRSGRLRGRRLELTAGAGLVRGSHPERELREVGLKLDVLLQQLNLGCREGSADQTAGSRAIV